jgi:molybdopterin-guanine dinucleotide biosynthesis protein A
MNQIKEFVGVVLAGGQSSRMGTDKACLELDGQSMMTRSVELLESVGAKEVFISRNEFKFGYLPDIYPGHGPLSGIHASMFATELPLLIIPVDMPFLNSNGLSNILNAGLTSDSPSFYQNYPLPLFLPNKREISLLLEKKLAQAFNDKASISLRKFLQHFSSLEITVNDESIFANANTPVDWEHFQTLNRIMNLSKNI